MQNWNLSAPMSRTGLWSTQLDVIFARLAQQRGGCEKWAAPFMHCSTLFTKTSSGVIAPDKYAFEVLTIGKARHDVPSLTTPSDEFVHGPDSTAVRSSLSRLLAKVGRRVQNSEHQVEDRREGGGA